MDAKVKFQESTTEVYETVSVNDLCITDDNSVELEKILRKVDLHFLPVAFVLLLLGFIDRSSVGNAKIAGMYTDLHLHGQQFNAALALFYAAYFVGEFAFSIYTSRLRLGIFLPSFVVIWGVVNLLHGFLHGFPGLAALRVSMGLLEAPVYPGCHYLITLWYPRHKAIQRFAYFYSASALAGVIGGFLARALLCLDGKAGIAGWRWIFIGEGIATCLMGLICLYFFPSSIAGARFLTPAEKELLIAVHEADYKSEPTAFSWHEVRQAFFHNWIIWSGGAISFCLSMSSFALSLFLPSIIHGFGYAPTYTQLLTVLPYSAAILACLGAGYLADKHRVRGTCVVVACAVGVLGYALLIALPQPCVVARYVAAIMATAGVSAAACVNLAWVGNNVRGHTTRAVAICLQAALGLVAGAPACFIFQERDKPTYRTPLSILLSFLALGCVLAGVQRRLLIRENEKLDEKGDAGMRFTP